MRNSLIVAARLEICMGLSRWARRGAANPSSRSDTVVDVSPGSGVGATFRGFSCPVKAAIFAMILAVESRRHAVMFPIRN